MRTVQVAERLADYLAEHRVDRFERVGVFAIGEERNDQRPAEEADHLDYCGGDPNANRPTSEFVAGKSAEQDRDRSEQSRGHGEQDEERDDRCRAVTPLSIEAPHLRLSACGRISGHL